jgi:membrane-bound lytic murein transglycosylase F
LIRRLLFLSILLVAVLAFWQIKRPGSGKAKVSSIDLDSIRKRGKLIAVTDFNSIDYFIYKGEPMGFNYELLKSFSDFVGIDLEIIAENNIKRAVGMVQSGEADVIQVPYEQEKLIKHVANGEIDYTVCDENVALVNATYYPDLDVTTPVSPSQDLAWGVRKENSEKLLGELNRWISVYRNTTSYALLHAKYFRNSRSSFIVKSDYYSLYTGKVSRYDDLIREFSLNIDWDWRLLASLICQESQFRPDVTSVAGAYGLMQIMPVTGRNFGIDITASPENNLKAGILYINWLYRIFNPKIDDEQERLFFILASYNAGPGHVLDAMRLAEKNGMDPQKWDGNVAVWLLKKSEPQYYRDSVVRNGYFRGNESVKFVSEVLDRFEHYKNIIPLEKSDPF